MNKYTCTGATCDFSSCRNDAHLLHHIKSKIPTKLSIYDLNLLPSRKDFINKLAGPMKTAIQKCSPMLFMAVSFIERTEFREYKIIMFGSLPCGSKAVVEITGIQIYVDIECATDFDTSKRDIEAWAMANNVNYKQVTKVELYPMHRFSPNKVPFVRVIFDSSWDRTLFIKSSQNNGWILSSDDNDYTAKVCRDHKFNTAGWNRITNYTVLDAATSKYNATYVLRVNISNFKRPTKEQMKIYNTPSNPLYEIIDKDNTMVCSWDIETYSNLSTGEAPTTNDQFTIFMICSAYFWHFSTAPLLTFCAVETDTGILNGVDITIICGDELNVLRAHIEILHRMMPDIMSAFNGGCFDWPLVKHKIVEHKLINTFISKVPTKIITFDNTEINLNKYFKHNEKIKIDADNNHDTFVTGIIPGILDIDILPTFLKIYPRAEVRKAASLNFFLQDNGIELKADMPYKKMFRIYERSKKLHNINKICHCETMDNCEVCRETINLIDNKSINHNGNTLYTDSLLDVLMTDGKPNCCVCGKYKQNLYDMSEVAYYCVVDCLRPHELCVKRMVFYDKRESSNLSHISLRDAFYKADGIKVVNTVGANCNKLEVAFSAVIKNKNSNEKEHYPGAFVFPPNRGFHCDGFIEITNDINNYKKNIHARPLLPLDFTSLYPSLMMTYNFSMDMLIRDETDANKYKAAGYNVHYIEPFEYTRGAKKDCPTNKKYVASGWTVRHNGIHTANDTHIVIGYEKIDNNNNVIDKYIYNESKNMVFDANIGAGVNRTSYRAIYGREKLPGERMGILAYSVYKIFNKRMPIKREYLFWANELSYMRKYNIPSKEIEVNGHKLTMTIDEVKFKVNITDSKQKALKILNNTFYGLTGFHRSPIYDVLVAGSVTSAGQINIKYVANIAEKSGFTIHYGDTDSIYLSAPDFIYHNCDSKYRETISKLTSADEIAEARREWWTEQVKITNIVANKFKEFISDHLIIDNGTNHLNMTFDDIAYPALICGKKKYFMISHLANAEPNFNNKVDVKGIDTKKQGTPGILKLLGEKFMNQVVSIHNNKDVLEIAKDIIVSYYNDKPDPNNFKQTAKYKPSKKNVAVHMFVERMTIMQKKYVDDPILSAIYAPPEPGDKFEYIIAKKPPRFTITGARHDYKKGEKMEYYRAYLHFQNTTTPIQIDYDHYMSKCLLGVFARFISYYPQFQPQITGLNPHDKKDYRTIDIESTNNAAEYIRNICYSISNPNREIAELSIKYKHIYSSASKLVKSKLSAPVKNITKLVKPADDVDNYISQITNTISIDANYAKNFVNYIVANTNLSSYDIYRIYKVNSSNYYRLTEIYSDNVNEALNQFTATINSIKSSIKTCNDAIVKYVDNIKNNIENEEFDVDENVYKNYYVYFIKYKSAVITQMKFNQLVTYINSIHRSSILDDIIHVDDADLTTSAANSDDIVSTW